METRFIAGGEFVDKATYIETRDKLSRVRERIATLEAERGRWYCEECGCGYCLDAEAALQEDSDEELRL